MTALGMPAFASIAQDKATTSAASLKPASRAADAPAGGDGATDDDGSFDAILQQKDHPPAVDSDPAGAVATAKAPDGDGADRTEAKGGADLPAGLRTLLDAGARTDFSAKVAAGATDAASTSSPGAANLRLANCKLESQMAETRMAEAKPAVETSAPAAARTDFTVWARRTEPAKPAAVGDAPAKPAVKNSPKTASTALLATDFAGSQPAGDQAAVSASAAAGQPPPPSAILAIAPAAAAARQQNAAPDVEGPQAKVELQQPSFVAPTLAASPQAVAAMAAGAAELQPSGGFAANEAKDDAKSNIKPPKALGVQVVTQRAYLPPVAADWTPKASTPVDATQAKAEKASASIERDKPAAEPGLAPSLAGPSNGADPAASAPLLQGELENLNVVKNDPPRAPTGVAVADNAKPALSTAGRRDLEITLAPEEWGGMSVRMKSAGDRLDIAFVADRGDTARMIADKSHDLTAQLHSAGIGLGGIDISSVATRPEAGAAPTGAGGFAQSASAEGQGGSTATPQRRDAAPGKQRNISDDSGDARPSAGSGGVYL